MDGTLRDPEGGARSESFTVRINGQNTTPVAYDQNVGVQQDSPRSFLLRGDDGDPGLVQALTYQIATYPTHGSLTMHGTGGSVTYTPNQSCLPWRVSLRFPACAKWLLPAGVETCPIVG